MASVASASSKSSTRVQWMWNAQTDPLSKSQPEDWRLYSGVENMIIEKAFAADETQILLDEYYIDLKCNLQVSNSDINEQRSIKRVVYNENDTRVREERVMHNPIAPRRPVGGQYGFVPPFIKEAAKDLKLTPEQLPSKDETVIPMIVERAALGIIEEGKNIKKQREGEEMANKLMEKKNEAMRDVWECCAELYSMESFLYKELNEIMRLIGSEQHEQVWRSKVRTWGPFCLLLWDNPFERMITAPGTTLYRGATLSDDLIASLQEDCSKDPKPWHSFQAFTPSSRNRNVAEQFGNALFIMKTRLAFTTDLSKLSKYSHEEEELIYPGVSFQINQMKFDKDKNKHLIYLNLQQRHDRFDQHYVTQSRTRTNDSNQATFDPAAYLNALRALFADGPDGDAARAVADARTSAYHVDRPYLKHYGTLDNLRYARLDDHYLRAVRNYLYHCRNYIDDVDMDLDVYDPYNDDEIRRAAVHFDPRFDPGAYDVARNHLDYFNRFGENNEWK